MKEVVVSGLPDSALQSATGNLLDPQQAQSIDTSELESQHISAIMPKVIEVLMRRATGEDAPVKLPEWPRLGRVLRGGLWPGLHVVTGPPGVSKTQFALQLALQAARQGVLVQYIGLEMDAVGLVSRFFCMMTAPIPVTWWSTLYTGAAGGGVDPVQTLNYVISKYRDQLAGLPLYLTTDFGPGSWSADDMEAAVDRLCAKQRELGASRAMLIVDFLQLLGAGKDNDRSDIRERIGRAAYAARQSARKHDAIVVLVSSTGRAHYAEMRLTLDKHGLPLAHADTLVGTGKESGEIEYAADSVLVLARATGGPDNNGNLCGDDPDAIWLAVAKNRIGASAWDRLEVRNGWLAEGHDCGPPNTGNFDRKAKKLAANAIGQKSVTGAGPIPSSSVTSKGMTAQLERGSERGAANSASPDKATPESANLDNTRGLDFGKAGSHLGTSPTRSEPGTTGEIGHDCSNTSKPNPYR